MFPWSEPKRLVVPNQINCLWLFLLPRRLMKTSIHGNTFRVTGPLCGESTTDSQQKRPVMQSFGGLFVVKLNVFYNSRMANEMSRLNDHMTSS